MARATAWAVLSVLGLSLAACSVGSNKAADETVTSDVPRTPPNTPHDPTPPAPPPAATTTSGPAPVAPANPHAAGGTDEAAAEGEEHHVTVRFGIMPDYGNDLPGVVAAEVFPGTAADLGGIKVGDRMTKWNGEDVPDVEGWMPFMDAARPGDKVIVTFIRGGKEMKTEVTLKARD